MSGLRATAAHDPRDRSAQNQNDPREKLDRAGPAGRAAASLLFFQASATKQSLKLAIRGIGVRRVELNNILPE